MSAVRWTNSSRRDFIASVSTLLGAAACPFPVLAIAKALPHLTDQDPQARALHYTEDVSKADAGSIPTHTAGAKCANCRLFQGSASDPFGPCQLYPGKVVSANGWCMGYQKK